jgi:anaerobic selenocysteine-containing dehydrogenase
METSRRDFLKKGALGSAAIAVSGSLSGVVAERKKFHMLLTLDHFMLM